MKELFDSITNIVTSAIGHDWTSMGAAIVATVQHGVELVTKIFGIG
ncbi:hemolysin-H1C [Staphylococcus schleiferi]|uniref:Beta-class phenol-soluble modulin n=1 Tax=Staphylococcus coagulans TaxID=74706 RepID=A0A9X0TPJ1_9STAP|nr:MULTISPECIES: beta-class phenol-soluble modulin [Staphylococcus]AKS66793.1 hemolysin-H1C [Staphylococcus schleiferi]AKS68905.1 hemolysin-H1C [Staphylococcus schleiferi]AKS71127.1 hemolysin-H1C [Staphylococcus schleiferi]AKS73299.1 hemolysin-H1C [Staphylococcus schleiferi]MBA8763036.1 beta-class phenol-soluble modulin [Staphylococcus coagulans]